MYGISVGLSKMKVERGESSIKRRGNVVERRWTAVQIVREGVHTRKATKTKSNA